MGFIFTSFAIVVETYIFVCAIGVKFDGNLRPFREFLSGFPAVEKNKDKRVERAAHNLNYFKTNYFVIFVTINLLIAYMFPDDILFGLATCFAILIIARNGLWTLLWKFAIRAYALMCIYYATPIPITIPMLISIFMAMLGISISCILIKLHAQYKPKPESNLWAIVGLGVACTLLPTFLAAFAGSL